MEIECQIGRKGTMKFILLQSFFMHYFFFVCVAGFSLPVGDRGCFQGGILFAAARIPGVSVRGMAVLSPQGLSGPSYLWQMPLASTAWQPAVSRWWCVSVLVGRKHFLLPLTVCEASDWCDSPCLHHGVARRTHIWSGGGMNLPEPFSVAKVEAGKHQA